MELIPRAIVDTDTGKILYQLQKGDRLYIKRFEKEQQTPNNRVLLTNGTWGKMYAEALDKLARLDLTASDYKAIMLLLPLVRPNSGLIAYGNYKPVNIAYVEKQLAISHKTAMRTIQKLMDLRIIAKNISGSDTQYFFNPYIYHKGRYINKTLYEMFKKSEWAKEANG